MLPTRFGERSLRSPLRFAAAAAAMTAALAHVPVLEDHFEEAPYIGVLFTLFIVATVALAALLLRRDGAWTWRALGGICSLAIGLLVWSRAIGLPQITDDVGNWTEPLAIVACAAEALAVALAAVALLRPVALRRPARAASWRVPRWAPGVAGIAVLGLGVAATDVAANSGAQASRGAMGGMAGMSGMSGMSGGGYWKTVAGQDNRGAAVTRTYYIEADEVVWNYAPDGRNDITGEPFDDVADTYVKSGPGRIGSTYLKCLYRGYSDGTFAHLQQRPPSQAYLGFLGPVIRAEVGDTIKVVFRNTCPFPASVHPHGVFYTKDSEGAPYDDGTSGADKLDDAVPTGGTHTYTWQVPGRAGPGPNDGSSVMWMYHSHTDEVADTYAGLMGPIEITRRGMARRDGSPTDVDREVFALFSVMDENKSPLLDESYGRFAQGPEPSPDDEEFQESNLMHSINGYVYGNMPMITMHKGQHVRWYVMSMGTEVDLHTPHWHGNTVLVNGMRMDTVSLLPASMVVADMVPDNAGTWLFHCHVIDHITAGMLTRYQVLQ